MCKAHCQIATMRKEKLIWEKPELSEVNTFSTNHERIFLKLGTGPEMKFRIFNAVIYRTNRVKLR